MDLKTWIEGRFRVASSKEDASITKPRLIGFRPASRRRSRIATGVALAACAVGGNVLVYASVNNDTRVLQVIRDIRAGQIVTADDLQVVEVGTGAMVPTVAAGDEALVVNQYARVYIAAGSLLVAQFVQPGPLVTPGQAVVAVEISPSAIPAGLRERSRVQLVISPDQSSLGMVPVSINGRIVAAADESDPVSGRISLSVEVAEGDAARLASSDDVRVVLLDPGDDLALDSTLGG